MQLALAARCQEVLQAMPTPLLEDLRRLAAWEQLAGEAPHRWAEAQQHYSAAVAAHEAQHGGPASAASAAGVEGASGGSGAAPAVLDAGADAALAQLLLQQAQAQEAPSASDGEGDDGSSAAAGGSSMLPIIYRAYKKMALWDAVLLADQ